MYCMLKSIYKFRPIRTLLWGVPNCFLTLFTYKNSKGFRRSVVRVDLHEDGRHVDLYFMEGRPKLGVDIKTLSTLDPH